MATIPEMLAKARSYLETEQPHEANEILRQVLASEPTNPSVWHLLGAAAFQGGNCELAVQYSRRSLVLMPNQPEVHNNLGLTFQVQGIYDQAVACYRQAITLKPHNPIAYFNLGNVFRDQRQLHEARLCYMRSLEFAPSFAEAHVALAALHLLVGDFERGWPGYEWRLKTRQVPSPAVRCPAWRGEPLDGKVILLHVEQGYGDAIQFVRYGLIIKSLGATVLLGCQKPLKNLLQGCIAIDRLLVDGDELPQFDVDAPLLSLPGIFSTRVETIPANVPYLFADPALVEKWRERLADVEGFRIGINCRGRSGQGLFRQRDIPLHCFAPLGELAGVRLISLQKGEGQMDLAGAKDWLRIVDLGNELDEAHGAFMDSAAIMMNLDLVITSDTAVAHLAGAIGVPVWVALPYVPDWRWLLDRTDSPWYPTMRLFRQKTSGDWAGVFAEIETALRQLVASKEPSVHSG
jgi:TPR repeat/Tetratricopeptide repeat